MYDFATFLTIDLTIDSLCTSQEKFLTLLK